MTDVRKATTHAGLGLYATKQFNPGDVILEELPLFTFQPTAEQFSVVRSQFAPKSFKGGSDNDDTCTLGENQSCLYDLIFELGDNDGDSNGECYGGIEKKRSKFLGMVTAAATFAIATHVDGANTSHKSSCTEINRKKLNQLYKPEFNISSASSCTSSSASTEKVGTKNDVKKHDDGEKRIVSLATTKVIPFIKENTLPGTALHKFVHENEEDCIGVMLIWSCNAFEGGHVYETMSRINHSCDFNAVISPSSSSSETALPSSASSLSGKAPIHNNEKQIVKATSVIQPNDEINISYLGSYTYAGMSLRKALLSADKFFDCHCTRCIKETSSSGGDVASALPCVNCHDRVQGRYLDEDVQYDDDDENEVCYALPIKDLTSTSGSSDGDCSNYVCQKCGPDHSFVLGQSLNATVEKTIKRVTSHLNECERQIGGSDYNDKRDEMIEMTERLIGLSHSVLGAKHYCTNLLLVQSLGQKLSAIHSSILTISTGQKRKKKGTVVEPEVDMTEIAECIDLLDRAFKFVQGLNLKSHPGHLLGNATVGVSRMLVSLGDVKSMKFGASWAEKVREYFSYGFEGNGMVKVVDSLLNAWKRKAGDEKEEGTNDQDRKKSKIFP
mmetsp:Transcript_18794/g.28144  ORF Transcript_18794/g.28144 Transcript_18794/m.28144 type:complete len:613 (-) Transcript_18794:306-2144(-)|eukprot:CAMPEP_0203665368 /NCGR_PEP_ID=MMETSP0090-20130426/2586_1 /ASSEMBLY_ACC=CAM_ASM_001088 /TAXON_ID=426623 /ORGANISM="Chaetoceros affinis, Strain CCMP159" /LENGTH=612 /DNA_ID=CAMNT_0050528885 /DNA_START=39 /DNA_END=1877 /DNA_ORIENTATION=-